MRQATIVADRIEPPALSRSGRRAVLAAMCLALVIVVSSVAMLNIALRDIALDLGATQTEQLWIVDSYVLVLAALLLPAGAAGDRFGRRTMLLAGMVIFGAASLLAAASSSPGSLIGWRAVAGIGAALIMPGTLATITSVFPPEERARAVGTWAGFAGGGALIGLLGAGALLERYSWSSTFVVTAALAGLALVITVLAVPNTQDPTHAHLDPLGSVLSLLGIGGVVLGVIEGPERGWTSGLTVGAFGVAAVTLAWFVVWELRTDKPLLDPRLFQHRGFATGSAALAALFLAMFGFFLVLLPFLQLILGYDTFKASLAILPMATTMLPLATVAATLSERLGHRWVGAFGLIVCAVSFFYMSFLDAGSSYWNLLPGLVAAGAGFALAMTPATNAIVASLPEAKQGVASAVNDTARELGAAVGIAVLGSALNAGYRHDVAGVARRMPDELGGAIRDSPAAGIGVVKQLGDQGLRLQDAVLDAFATGMRWSMLAAGALLLVAAISVFVWAPTRSGAVGGG